ncbi:MAG TPA: hypothetical protein VJT16_17200 [Streptosporangiaceae bacterium]|nr:hypothetical protein [Streptosporangiaceae bacterium]
MSTIATALIGRGLACIDDDDDPFLARFVDDAGNVVEEPAALHLCGGADNQLELADRFACACSGRFPSMPHSPSTKWWTRYWHARHRTV